MKKLDVTNELERAQLEGRKEFKAALLSNLQEIRNMKIGHKDQTFDQFAGRILDQFIFIIEMTDLIEDEK